MGQVLVRNLEDDVIANLRMKAALKGRPLEAELREILTNAAPFTRDERLAVSQTLRAANKSTLPDIKAAIRAGRDDEN